MNAIDPKVIGVFAKSHKIEDITAEKVLWLSKVLSQISQSSLSKDFALMGGSAIVFLYRDMYRLSTDLDLDFIGNPSLGSDGDAEIRRIRTAHKRVWLEIARTLGMELTEVKQSKPILRFVQYELEYSSRFARRAVVELDISYRYCHAVLDPVSRKWPIKNKEVLPFSIQTLRPEELYASKVLAIVEGKLRLDFPGKIGLLFKRKIRHLYDVYLLASDVESGEKVFNLKKFHMLVLLFGLTRIDGFEFFRGNSIGSYDDSDIERELISVTPRGIKIPTAREMKWVVRKFFDDHVFNYSKLEHRFIEDFNGKNFRPEDLFGSGVIARNLKKTHYYKEILGKVKAITK